MGVLLVIGVVCLGIAWLRMRRLSPGRKK